MAINGSGKGPCTSNVIAWRISDLGIRQYLVIPTIENKDPIEGEPSEARLKRLQKARVSMRFELPGGSNISDDKGPAHTGQRWFDQLTGFKLIEVEGRAVYVNVHNPNNPTFFYLATQYDVGLLREEEVIRPKAAGLMDVLLPPLWVCVDKLLDSELGLITDDHRVALQQAETVLPQASPNHGAETVFGKRLLSTRPSRLTRTLELELV